MEGRHVHPSTLYPGGVGTVPTVQLFTDYLVRLMQYVEFMKKVVPLHDDLFDFFYEALPGYEEVGQRRVLLGCWGSFNDPDVCDYTYKNMNEWGNAMYVTPASSSTASWSRPTWWTSTSDIRILLGSSYYDDWAGKARRSSRRTRWATRSTSGTPGTRRRCRGRRSATSTASTPGSCRRAGSTSGPASTWRSTPAAGRSRGSGRRRWRAWSTSATSRRPARASRSTCRRRRSLPEVEFEWKIPKWSNTIERDRARTYFQAYAAAAALYFVEQALAELHAGRTKTWTEFKVPDEAIGCGFHEAVRGVLSHHVVIRDGKIANYHPYPPTPWNASPRDIYGTPGPYEDAVQNTPIFEENGPDNFKGIDIMRDGAQLRPVPALRRPHVPGQRQGARDPALADVRRAAMNGDDWGRRDEQDSRTADCSGSRRWSKPSSATADPQRSRRARRSWSRRSSTCTVPGSSGSSRSSRRHGGRRRRDASIGFAGDELVGSLLLLHGLHPVDFETRVTPGARHAAALLRVAGRQRRAARASRKGSFGCGCRAAATAAPARRRSSRRSRRRSTRRPRICGARGRGGHRAAVPVARQCRWRSLRRSSAGTIVRRRRDESGRTWP